MGINLKSLFQKSRENASAKKVMYDKDYKVSFEMNFLPKAELQRLISKHTKIEFNTKTHSPEEKIDQKKLSSEMAKMCIVGWEGVTYEWLITQVPLQVSEDQDMKEEIPFSDENLEALLSEAYNLENWVFETVKDASNFSNKVENEIKN